MQLTCQSLHMHSHPTVFSDVDPLNGRQATRAREVAILMVGRLATVVLFSISVPAWAHDTWLVSEQRSFRAGSTLTLEMTSGERFPTLGSVISPNRIEQSACRQGSSTFNFKPGRREPKALRLSAQPPESGAVTCWVQLAPRALELKEADVAHYLDEIDAPLSVRRAWENAPSPRRWIETYTKNAKVLVPAENASEASPAKSPVGLKLEFVLLTDLSAKRVDGNLPVQVLLDGKPQGGLSVALTGEEPGAPQRQRTNAQGEVLFKGTPAGRWMLSATDLRPAEQRPGEWESQFTTLVFEILPESR
jgi:hypothetical protein